MSEFVMHEDGTTNLSRRMISVSIGRNSGSSTDRSMSASFTESELEIVKDTLAIVNAATNDKEQWGITLDDGTTIIPTTQK